MGITHYMGSQCYLLHSDPSPQPIKAGTQFSDCKLCNLSLSLKMQTHHNLSIIINAAMNNSAIKLIGIIQYLFTVFASTSLQTITLYKLHTMYEQHQQVMCTDLATSET